MPIDPEPPYNLPAVNITFEGGVLDGHISQFTNVWVAEHQPIEVTPELLIGGGMMNLERAKAYLAANVGEAYVWEATTKEDTAGHPLEMRYFIRKRETLGGGGALVLA